MERVMALLLAGFIVVIGVSLYRVNTTPGPPELLDLVTATDKCGQIRFDARKCFECGAFFVSTWIVVYLTLTGKLTEWAYGGYMAAWVVSRYLGDKARIMDKQTS